ncbi:carcinoembryonic antigen-related cell adhesion molecule 3 [Chrysemys picta bellii]|uniref:carcinoembryonic antigen-related cell adhesion molecule 3 n=1 Tax=Chrysemys picta bellii TaxID=8478 RepID=UPI0032B0FFBF
MPAPLPPTTTSPVSALCPQLGTRRLCRPGSSRRVPQQRRAMGRIPHRPGGPWTGILLAASVLGSCLQPAPAQTPTPVTIIIISPSPVVGGGVSLAPQPPPENLVSCSWYRSATVTDPNSRILTYVQYPNPVQIPGPAHTGRETLGPGCALNIAGLTLSDTGNYTVQIQIPTAPNPDLSITVALRVYDAHRSGSPSGLIPGAVAGIVIGLLVGAALVGAGVYFLYSRCQNETPKENEAPVLVYENLPPTAWMGSVAQPGNPPDPSPTYQTLQPRQPDVYEELKK